MDWLRAQAFLSGVITLAWVAGTAFVMLNAKLRSSITLLQFVSFYAIVLSHGIIWREFRGELRTRKVQREVKDNNTNPKREGE